MRQTTCNWIKKILGNLNGKCIFNILILLFVYIMFNKLTCKVRYEAWVNAIRLVSLKTFLKSTQNQSLSSEICSGSSHEICHSLPIIFQRNWPWKSREFPAKSGVFSANSTLKIPWNLTFFSRPTRSSEKSAVLLSVTSRLSFRGQVPCCSQLRDGQGIRQVVCQLNNNNFIGPYT